MSDHDSRVQAIAAQVRERVAAGALVHIDKGGVHHVVPIPGDPRFRSAKLDTSALRHILTIDAHHRRCTAEPGVTFRDIVRATLPLGLVPTVVPELEGITLGGAVAGCAVESMSFRLGGFFDSVQSLELVTGTGEVLELSPPASPTSSTWSTAPTAPSASSPAWSSAWSPPSPSSSSATSASTTSRPSTPPSATTARPATSTSSTASSTPPTTSPSASASSSPTPPTSATTAGSTFFTRAPASAPATTPAPRTTASATTPSATGSPPRSRPREPGRALPARQGRARLDQPDPLVRPPRAAARQAQAPP
ncbi:MAG: FAD-dependent oxidoreductase [Nannocystis sp.]|nr:FAD-dependent oxidoreductase [Nannocystis sp.]